MNLDLYATRGIVQVKLGYIAGLLDIHGVADERYL